MAAFLPLSAPRLLLRPSRTQPLATTSRRPRPLPPAAPRASYAADLRTRTTHIDHAETDALLTSITSSLASHPTLPQPTLEAMVCHLADTRGMARLGLVEAFGTVGPPAVPALLAGLTTCPNPVVRRSCGKALAKIGDAAATPALIDALLHDEDIVTRSSAAGALARMGRTAVPPLLALIADPAASMTAKGHAAWAVAFMRGDAADALLDALHDADRDVRVAIVSALGAVAIGDALPAMGAASADDWGEPDTVTKELRARAADALRTALDDPSAEVRAEAATALSNAGCSDQAPRIAEMLADADVELRRCSALALMKLGYFEALERLQMMAENVEEHQDVRSVASLAARTLQRAQEEEDDEWE